MTIHGPVPLITGPQCAEDHTIIDMHVWWGSRVFMRSLLGCWCQHVWLSLHACILIWFCVWAVGLIWIGSAAVSAAAAAGPATDWYRGCAICRITWNVSLDWVQATKHTYEVVWTGCAMHFQINSMSFTCFLLMEVENQSFLPQIHQCSKLYEAVGWNHGNLCLLPLIL